VIPTIQTYDEDSRTLTVTHSELLSCDTTYCVRLPAGAAKTNAEYLSGYDFEFTFTTAKAGPIRLVLVRAQDGEGEGGKEEEKAGGAEGGGAEANSLPPRKRQRVEPVLITFEDKTGLQAESRLVKEVAAAFSCKAEQVRSVDLSVGGVLVKLLGNPDNIALLNPDDKLLVTVGPKPWPADAEFKLKTLAKMGFQESKAVQMMEENDWDILAALTALREGYLKEIAVDLSNS